MGRLRLARQGDRKTQGLMLIMEPQLRYHAAGAAAGLGAALAAGLSCFFDQEM
jgi:hypothetical protein